MKRLATTSRYSLVLLLGVLGLTASVQAKQAPVYVLSASDWNVPRTSKSILSMPALQHTMQAYNKNPKATIQVHYPGGDEGTLWGSRARLIINFEENDGLYNGNACYNGQGAQCDGGAILYGSNARYAYFYN